MARKTYQQIAKEVIQGKWGNGVTRRMRLTAAGYNYNQVQALVNQMTGAVTKKKSDTEIAKEVIAGKWGNGNDRKQRLTKAGYNYNNIQKTVNALLAQKGARKMAYWARTYAPSETDPLWINTGYGGDNKCIVINRSTGSVLPNCTGYVHGRWMEIGNTTREYNLSLGNANTYWRHNDGYQRGSEPKEGAVLCFGGQYGHVCIVEKIIDTNTILCSESDYGGARFTMRYRYRKYNWKPGSGWTLPFQGFIYHPDVGEGTGGSGNPDEPVEPVPDEPIPYPQQKKGKMPVWMMARRRMVIKH